MKERPILFSGEMVKAILEDKKTQTRRVIKPQPVQDSDRTWRIEMNPRSGYNSEKTMREFLPKRCPYGEPGDRLWVKETWAGDEFTGYAYRATEPDALPFGEEFTFNKWRPAIFMPRKASRIDLEIVKIRVERLKEINNEDAIAEGVSGYSSPYSEEGPSPRDRYRSLWEKINGVHFWELDPWVWVIEFKRLETGVCSHGYDMSDGENF